MGSKMIVGSIEDIDELVGLIDVIISEFKVIIVIYNNILLD